MNPVAAQEVALDNALVAHEKRLNIEKCNARIEFSNPQRETMYQVTLDALKLSSRYPAFLITAEVPEVYMHQFWNTIKKIKDTDAYWFKLDKRKFRIDTEVFCEILQIFLRLPNQDFVEPPSEEEMVPFVKELGYTRKCDMLSEIHTDHMHQPWRTFVAVINRCISGKLTDVMFQADNREISSARKENMPYPRFAKVIINYFISKDKTISMRNRINLHTVRDYTLLGTLNFVSKTQDYQKYGTLILEEMINQDIKDSKAYKTYLAFSTGQATLKKARKFKKIASLSKKLYHVLEEEPAKKPKRAKKPAKKSTTMPKTGVVIRDTPGVSMSQKKVPAKVDRGKGMDLLSNVALLKAAQLKKPLKKSKQDTNMLHASGLGDGVGSQPKVPDESQDKTTVINEGTGTKPGVPNVPKDQSKSENKSWGDSGDDDSNDDDSTDVSNNDDDDVDSDVDGDNEASDSERTNSNEDENPNLNQNDDEKEEYEEEYIQHEKEGKGDAEMTDAGRDDVSQEKSYEQVEDDAHVTLTAAHVTQKTEGLMQSSYVSSYFACQFLNLDNVPPVDNEVVSMMNVNVFHEEPSTRTPSLLTILVTLILETSTAAAPTIPSTISPITPLPQQSAPSHNAQAENDRYIDLIEKSVKHIIKDEVKIQLPQILPKEVSDFATPVIQSTITESLENVVLAKSSSQPKSMYEAAASLTRGRDDKEKDEDPPAGSDQGLKRRKASKDAEPSKGSTSKESKSSSSKGTKSQSKLSGKSTQVEESVFEVADTEMPQNQGSDLGHTDDQPNVEAASKDDWFKKPERPSTPDHD
ncbi:hypothetical protein Tco_0665358 [Tanacetum coccineum]